MGGNVHYDTIIYHKEERIALITLNRPQTLNAWNLQMGVEAVEAIGDAGRDDNIRVLILTGAGRGFSSGLDVDLLLQIVEGRLEGASRLISGFRQIPSIVSAAYALREMTKPVIAAINGIAAGGGFGLALACDLRIASDQARFSQIFVERALIPDTGSTYFLPKIVGVAKALELALTADIIDAHEAQRLGLVNRVVPHGELMAAATELARKIAAGPPLAVALTKRAMHKGAVETSVGCQLDYELSLNSLCVTTEDFKEGVRSFLEKRAPEFTGR